MDPVLNIIANSFRTNWWCWILVPVIAYLLGSINPAVIVTKAFTKGKKDIREMGSGNAGFTNVLRSVGKVPAIITIVCDALKCVIAVLIGGWLFSFIPVPYDYSGYVEMTANCGKYLAGIFCIIGHSFPLYFHFKGGKGVVSAAALMLTEDWRVFLMILATFLILFLITKIISVGSITSALMYGPYTFLATFFFDRLPYGNHICASYIVISTCAALIIGIFVTVKHKDNIKRLLRGEEKKIHVKK
ncbi:MAG TPA: acyl-phosphate glycerol 3-phosphate acyltransferase [Ruminococcaceae bacterium]|nr:acyl-phosphate glycerol 3-phosphate acyltransferase [Oscillospiraceae bacterium]